MTYSLTHCNVESLTGKRLVEDKNLSKIQDQLGGDVSGYVIHVVRSGF